MSGLWSPDDPWWNVSLSLFTCNLAEVEMSFIQDGIPATASWWDLFCSGAGPCMGQQQIEICGNANVSAVHATATRCGTNKGKLLSWFFFFLVFLNKIVTKYFNKIC